MALWGNNDAVGSGGLVSLNYSTGVVTGSGTTFGLVGAASTGDVIRFGIRGSGGTYFGDAVIVGIASTTQLTIGSTAGLSGASIASTDFTVSQLPKYTILDSSFSETLTSTASSVGLIQTGTATTNAGVGTDIVETQVSDFAIAGDFLVNGGGIIQISSVGASSISLASTISAGIATGDVLSFKRNTGGYNRYVFGTDSGGVGSASGTQFETGVGWVGVTTYIDNTGSLRVKKEILVAMSGIQTGNTPLYNGNPDLA